MHRTFRDASRWNPCWSSSVCLAACGLAGRANPATELRWSGSNFWRYVDADQPCHVFLSRVETLRKQGQDYLPRLPFWEGVRPRACSKKSPFMGVLLVVEPVTICSVALGIGAFVDRVRVLTLSRGRCINGISSMEDLQADCSRCMFLYFTVCACSFVQCSFILRFRHASWRHRHIRSGIAYSDTDRQRWGREGCARPHVLLLTKQDSRRCLVHLVRVVSAFLLKVLARSSMQSQTWHSVAVMFSRLGLALRSLCSASGPAYFPVFVVVFAVALGVSLRS